MMRVGSLFLSLAALVYAADAPDLLREVHSGNHAAVKKLLADGVNVNSADADGTTALMHSVVDADTEMVKILIGAGADVNATNAAGSTALMYASTDLAKTQLLLAANADVNVKNKRGATPMTVAVQTYGSTPVLKLLVAKGAKPEGRLMAPVAQKGDLEAIQIPAFYRR
jgi:ankyrin repeat protein